VPHKPKPGDVLISMTNGAYGDGTRAINLWVEDESTGKFIVNVDLTGEQYAAILGGAVTRVSGAKINFGS
jgi:hypothetical protein